MPEPISTAAAIVTILDKVGGWPISLVLVLVFLMPPVLLSVALWRLSKALVDLRDEVRDGMAAHDTHYENNVLLVENYEKLATELITEIRLSTTATSEMIGLLKTLVRRSEK